MASAGSARRRRRNWLSFSVCLSSYSSERDRVIMLIGYMRVSTNDQNHNLQKDALKTAGCERIFQDVISGASETRTGLSDALAALQPGDTFVVWRLDRLGRSLVHLVTTVNELEKRGV